MGAPDGTEVTDSDCTLKNYGGCIKCCEFSISGELLCIGSTDCVVRVWRVSVAGCDIP